MTTTKEYTFYRICSKNPEIKDCYVGSTTQFRNRKWEHKRRCNVENQKNYNIYIYQFIRDNGGWENWDMIEIEKMNLETKQDALKRERYFLELYNASLNQQIPSRTKKEYYEENKEHLIECKKIHYKNNKDYYKNYNKEYRENNIDKLNEQQKEYRKKNIDKVKEQQKEYRKINNKKLNEYDRQKYIKNREFILKKQAEIKVCICGLNYTHNHKSRHLKSKKHQQYLAKQELKNNIII